MQAQNIADAKKLLREARTKLNDETNALLEGMPALDNAAGKDRSSWFSRMDKCRKAVKAIDDAMLDLAGLS